MYYALKLKRGSTIVSVLPAICRAHPAMHSGVQVLVLIRERDTFARISV